MIFVFEKTCGRIKYKVLAWTVSFLTLWMKFSILVWRPHHLNLTVTSLYAHIRGASGLAKSSFCGKKSHMGFIWNVIYKQKPQKSINELIQHSPSSPALKVHGQFSLTERLLDPHPVYNPVRTTTGSLMISLWFIFLHTAKVKSASMQFQKCIFDFDKNCKIKIFKFITNYQEN